MDAHRYEQSVPTLAECKQRVLGEYNMFEYVAHLCDQLNPDAPKQQVTIHPCRSGQSWENLMNYTFMHNYYKLITKLHFLRYGNQLQST